MTAFPPPSPPFSDLGGGGRCHPPSLSRGSFLQACPISPYTPCLLPVVDPFVDSHGEAKLACETSSPSLHLSILLPLSPYQFETGNQKENLTFICLACVPGLLLSLCRGRGKKAGDRELRQQWNSGTVTTDGLWSIDIIIQTMYIQVSAGTIKNNAWLLCLMSLIFPS